MLWIAIRFGTFYAIAVITKHPSLVTNNDIYKRKNNTKQSCTTSPIERASVEESDKTALITATFMTAAVNERYYRYTSLLN